MNGAGLRYTCCNRRAHPVSNGMRPTNGCKSAHHVCSAGASAWEVDPSGGVRPRLTLEAPTTSVSSDTGAEDCSNSGGSANELGMGTSGYGSSACNSRAGSPVGSPPPLEWQMLIERPSRLLTSF